VLAIAVGVRALVNGYWGFAALDGMASADDMTRLGREAAAQAKTGALGKARAVQLAPAPIVANGAWTMPVEIDPFTVDPGEKVDFMLSVDDVFRRQGFGIGTAATLHFVREDRTFGSSEGSFTTQTVYWTAAGLNVGAEGHFSNEREGARQCDLGTWAGAGWEYIRQTPFREQSARLIDEARRSRTPKPVEVGRYDMVFDASAMAKILDVTLGAASEIDRVFGYRANTVGTSFIDDPLAMLGSHQIASPLVTVTTNRSAPGGAATVRWDDEGVVPVETTVIKNGILTDLLTTRESASWLEPYYRKVNRPVQSAGCAGSDAATMPVQVSRPNLVMEASDGRETFQTLVAATKKGIAVCGGGVTTDQQCLNGAGYGDIMYEIDDGKLGRVIGGANYIFRAPDFWKHLVATGGTVSAQTIGVADYPAHALGTTLMGRPRSVTAVPAKVAQVAVIDVLRKA